ncbi:helix-turn-helix domain-containing protein [Rhizobium pisi]|uniref:helix-turn-helix domain-containing protein n=1 Tax=Rhizobium pisi TaxID=574561 RepID=UPI0039B01168
MVNSNTIMSGASKANPADPLIIAINAYIDGVAAFNAVDEEDLPDETFDDLAAAMFHGPEAVLRHWQTPARSHEAALAAISLAEREKAAFEGESPVADAMEAAAIGYWKNLGGSSAEPHASTEVPAPIVVLKDLSPDTCLTAPEAAAYLRVAEVTLARWRSTKRGPEYTKSGGRVLYRVSALLNYVKKNERQGTRPDK